jgi:hypothetical protein
MCEARAEFFARAPDRIIPLGDLLRDGTDDLTPRFNSHSQCRVGSTETGNTSTLCNYDDRRRKTMTVERFAFFIVHRAILLGRPNNVPTPR